MNHGTRQALQESISHWIKVAEQGAPKQGDEDCALCQRFAYDSSQLCKLGQEYCPLSDQGEGCCEEWEDFCDESTYDRDGGHMVADTPESKAAAQAMVAKLKSLL